VGRRLLPVALLVLSLAAIPAAQAIPGGQVLGPQRILVALVTWGPKPFAREEVEHVVFNEADAFYRRTSFGKASLTGTVTPWLTAYSGRPQCVANSLREPGATALRAAGYDLSAYDVLVYLHPDAGCAWSGATYAGVVFLNGELTARLVSHELGHAFGLPHANTTNCIRHSCATLEYGDPYDTMGSGVDDFSAFAKLQLGWITRVSYVRRSGAYTIASLEKASTSSQALVVTTALDQYWIEYRTEPGRSDTGVKKSDPGVLVHVSASPDLRNAIASNTSNALVTNPSLRARPELLPGDRFTYPGVFRISVVGSSATSARLRFKWIDKTPPAAPRITSAIVGGQLRVEVERGREIGSGLARYQISVDGRAPLNLGSDATEAPVEVGRPLPGTHTVKVVAFDRAGNHSAPVVRRVRVP
jgi:hypothetical protein